MSGACTWTRIELAALAMLIVGIVGCAIGAAANAPARAALATRLGSGIVRAAPTTLVIGSVRTQLEVKCARLLCDQPLR